MVTSPLRLELLEDVAVGLNPTIVTPGAK